VPLQGLGACRNEYSTTKEANTMHKSKDYTNQENIGMRGNASARKFAFAQGLREEMTETELILWSKLRAKQLANLKFRRQHPYNRFVLNFHCHSLKLSIEIDGGVHKKRMNAEYDLVRTQVLKDNGIKEIRFTNQQVKQNIETVLQIIENKAQELKSKTEK